MKTDNELAEDCAKLIADELCCPKEAVQFKVLTAITQAKKPLVEENAVLRSQVENADVNLEQVKMVLKSQLAEVTKCAMCNGEGEVHCPTSVPDAEPWETCQCCNGKKVIPTCEEIAVLRQKSDEHYWSNEGEKLSLQEQLSTALAKVEEMRDTQHMAYRYVLGTACVNPLSESEQVELGKRLANWESSTPEAYVPKEELEKANGLLRELEYDDDGRCACCGYPEDQGEGHELDCKLSAHPAEEKQRVYREQQRPFMLLQSSIKISIDGETLCTLRRTC